MHLVWFGIGVDDGSAANGVHHNCVGVAHAFVQSGDKPGIDATMRD